MQDWQERFWAKVDKRGPDDCWEWQRYQNRDGYGCFNRGGGRILAHRAAWEIVNGPIPGGLDCLHTCDNPPCCNPAHLFLGTNLDNIADKVAKGRSLWGEKNPRNKLTGEQVRLIRVAYRAERGECKRMAELYGVSHSLISMIISGKLWRQS